MIIAMCNPFADYGKVLFRLHTMEILPEAAVLCTERLQEAGLEQYESYVNERLVTHTKSVFKPIEKNRLDLMAPTSTRQIKTPQEKTLQDTCSTLAQLYGASEVRGGSSDEFFSHENQIYPSSLSKNGNLRSNAKSDLCHPSWEDSNPHPRIPKSKCRGAVHRRSSDCSLPATG